MYVYWLIYVYSVLFLLSVGRSVWVFYKVLFYYINVHYGVCPVNRCQTVDIIPHKNKESGFPCKMRENEVLPVSIEKFFFTNFSTKDELPNKGMTLKVISPSYRIVCLTPKVYES